MPPSVLDDTVVAGWNDLDLLKQAFERHKGEIAGVIMEPMMVNGGAALPEPGYLQSIKEIEVFLKRLAIKLQR